MPYRYGSSVFGSPYQCQTTLSTKILSLQLSGIEYTDALTLVTVFCQSLEDIT